MTINIPSGLLDKYKEACDFFIDNDIIGRSCTIVYPPKREACVNCIKPVGTTSTNVYRHGGPAPFNFGACPLCGGNGYKETEITTTIRLRIYWSRADWIRIVGSIVADDAEVMIIGKITDLLKVKRAANIILVQNNNEATYRTSLVGQPVPWGFGRDNYFVAYLKGA